MIEVAAEGGIAVLKGNIAPEGSVVKQTAVSDKMMKFSGESKYNVIDANDEIDAAFEMENPDDMCSIHNLSMNATISNIKKENLGNVMMSYDVGF